MLPGPIALDSVTVVLVPYNDEIARTISVGILNAKDQTVQDRQVTVLHSQVQVSLKGQEAYGIRLGASNATRSPSVQSQ